MPGLLFTSHSRLEREQHRDTDNVKHGQDTDQEEDGRVQRSVREADTMNEGCTIGATMTTMVMSPATEMRSATALLPRGKLRTAGRQRYATVWSPAKEQLRPVNCKIASRVDSTGPGRDRPLNVGFIGIGTAGRLPRPRRRRFR